MAFSRKVTMKLFIDAKRRKVLFAEATKEVIDFLFHLLELNLDTLLRRSAKLSFGGERGFDNLYQNRENFKTHLQPNQRKGIVPSSDDKACEQSKISKLYMCLYRVFGNLYKSMKNLKITYSQPTQCKGIVPSSDDNSCEQSKIPKLYMCPYRCAFTVTEEFNSRCTHCSNNMFHKVKYISKKEVRDPSSSSSSSSSNTGFVKEVVTYMVMDDLVIQPMSTTISITNVLNQFNVEVGALEEKMVKWGIEEGLEILMTSLQCETILTEVFLRKRGWWYYFH